mgnify:CR=1 FL=1
MELKHGTNFIVWIHEILLIVPYGIETILPELKESTTDLLIVPYGIETQMQKE